MNVFLVFLSPLNVIIQCISFPSFNLANLLISSPIASLMPCIESTTTIPFSQVLDTAAGSVVDIEKGKTPSFASIDGLVLRSSGLETR